MSRVIPTSPRAHCRWPITGSCRLSTRPSTTSTATPRCSPGHRLRQPPSQSPPRRACRIRHRLLARLPLFYHEKVDGDLLHRVMGKDVLHPPGDVDILTDLRLDDRAQSCVLDMPTLTARGSASCPAPHNPSLEAGKRRPEFRPPMFFRIGPMLLGSLVGAGPAHLRLLQDAVLVVQLLEVARVVLARVGCSRQSSRSGCVFRAVGAGTPAALRASMRHPRGRSPTEKDHGPTRVLKPFRVCRGLVDRVGHP